MPRKKMSFVSLTELTVEVGETLSLEDLSRAVKCDPEYVLELSEYGVVEQLRLVDGNTFFTKSALPRLSRGLRLLNDLDVDISSLGLVLDLLERIDNLEEELSSLRSKLGEHGPGQSSENP